MNHVLTNIYIFEYGLVFIYALQFFAILAVLYIAFALVAWPIRHFMRAMKRLIDRSGHY